MNILYSDFDKRETKSKLSSLSLSLEEINRAKDSTSDGFVFAKTRDHSSLDILRWEFVTGPDRVKFNTAVQDEPEKIQDAITEAVRRHDSSSETVVDICFYLDMVENPDVEWPNQHVIAICDWRHHSDVVTGKDITRALEWVARSR
jgi:hypothetical protein